MMIRSDDATAWTWQLTPRTCILRHVTKISGMNTKHCTPSQRAQDMHGARTMTTAGGASTARYQIMEGTSGNKAIDWMGYNKNFILWQSPMYLGERLSVRDCCWSESALPKREIPVSPKNNTVVIHFAYLGILYHVDVVASNNAVTKAYSVRINITQSFEPSRFHSLRGWRCPDLGRPVLKLCHVGHYAFHIQDLHAN